MSKVQFFAQADGSTLANFTSPSTGFAAQLSDAIVSVGWTRIPDPNGGMVNFANLTAAMLTAIALTTNNHIPIPNNLQRFQGAHDSSGATSYTGTFSDNALVDWVTESGVSFICLVNPNTLFGSVTAVGNASGGNTAYTYSILAGGTMPPVGSSVKFANLAANNNGTFVVQSVTTTSVVVNNPSGTAQTGQTGSIVMASTCATDLYDGGSLGSTATGHGHWAVYPFEIFTTGDAASATNPIYLKLTYSNNTSAGPLYTPNVSIIVGTGVINSGTGTNYMQLTGNVVAEARGTGSAESTTQFECDVQSESGGSLSFLMWRNQSQASLILVLDRARDINGAMQDSYVFYGLSQSFGNTAKWQIIFKPGTGALFPVNADNAWPSLVVSSTTTSLSVGGLVCVTPIFPLVGYVGNPILAAIGIRANDCVEGETVNVVMYGATHTYLVTKLSMGSTAFGAASNGVGIRWE